MMHSRVAYPDQRTERMESQSGSRIQPAPGSKTPSPGGKPSNVPPMTAA
jgi:hypothetical protein